tara:strand:+ start:170 stop:364 length:195 start_codon:yes stop_codon:yes gene_type:complete
MTKAELQAELDRVSAEKVKVVYKPTPQHDADLAHYKALSEQLQRELDAHEAHLMKAEAEGESEK